MPEIRFSSHIYDQFPQHREDLRELEGILAKHAQIEIRDLQLPGNGSELVRESILCRMLTFAFTASIRSERLLESIIQSFNSSNLHASYVLVRSHLELTALTHYAAKNIQELTGAGNWEKLDEFLERLVLGNLYMSKAHEYPVQPFHIGSVVRELDEISPNISQMYYLLSEFTHPNMGALVLSADIDNEQGIAHFERHKQPIERDYMQTINIAIATGQLALKAIEELLELDVGKLLE